MPIRVCFWKRKQRAIWISTSKMGYKFWKCANQPQSYLKIQFSWNNHYLGIQVGSTDINNVFGLPPTFVTWDNKVTSTKKRIFRDHKSATHFKVMTLIQDLPHPRCFLPYVQHLTKQYTAIAHQYKDMTISDKSSNYFLFIFGQIHIHILTSFYAGSGKSSLNFWQVYIQPLINLVLELRKERQAKFLLVLTSVLAARIDLVT